jgi:hypothetical protein
MMGEALPLQHSWPLWERAVHFDLGHVLNCAITDAIIPAQVGALGAHHVGLWECNLADSALVWSGGVYDIFGLQRDCQVTREQALAHYCEESLVKLEKLRAHAVRHRRGFTLDVEIYAASVGDRRSMRIVAAPEIEGNAVIRLHGLKFAL